MERLILVAMMAASACGSDDDYAIATQGGPPVVSGGGAAALTFRGQVCRSDDLRELSTCAIANTGGLTVSAGTVTTMTDAAGAFTLTLPREALAGIDDASVEVTGPGVVPTATPLSALATTIGPGTIQVIDADLYARMLTSNGVLRQEGTGAIIGSVTRDGAPVQGISVATAPGTDFGPFYDATTPVTWGLGGTATRGVFWVPGLVAGMVDLAFESTLGGLETTVAGVQVRNGGVTILDTVLPGTIP